ncbi:ATP-binding protein [Bacteriovorax sp. DB6_IX]|uniref:ATP-binding protein n=1 Tax=Bacteriovorax sp. DB6_IX TaxID=1353530 RepID=UPI00038A1679|nr:ATP-binding protein [Bacteriovorax sp. DB6_IX]EQC50592.1 GHKL domain protein [Bacteriovorax sp. DB6_IX]
MSLSFFKSVKSKLFFSIFMIVLCFSLLIANQVLGNFKEHMKTSLLGQKKAVGISVRTLIKNQLKYFVFDDLNDMPQILKNISLENEEIEYIYLTSNTGVVLYKFDPINHIVDRKINFLDELRDDVQFEIDYEYYESDLFYESLVPIIQKGQFVGRVHVGTRKLIIDSYISNIVKKVFYLLGFISILLVPVFYWLISRIVIEPLNVLSGKVKALAREKDFTAQISLKSSSEFQTLAQDFNYMNTSLANYYADIQSLNQNLEQIVKKRTDELVKTSDDLRDKNSTLRDTLKDNERMQKILIQQEKLASLGEVVAGIAHEINNPLNFVINGATISKRTFAKISPDLPEEHQRYIKMINSSLDMIHENGHRATSIVKNMLSHARGSKGEKEVVNLKILIEDYLKLAMHGFKNKGNLGKEVILDKQFDPSVPLTSVVKQDFERVLLNLFNNAFYAMEKRKESEGEGYSPRLTIKLAYGHNNIQLKIRDNGIGIPKEVQDKIFNPFFTTKPSGEGTGLGMSLCHDIIANGHDGEIKLESREGDFTEFTILMPVSV